jgi:phosphatidylserine/phosphatidylglycerophosphate/cardiolipin synthase-like enzyme
VTGDLQASLLTDGGQRAEDVAAQIVTFVRGATKTLDVAIYDFEARQGAAGAIADALEDALAHGVGVRVTFNSETPEVAADPRPMSANPDLIDGLSVPTRAVSEQGSLMHHKYVVRDGNDVLTGSTNWTGDAFSREENILITFTDVPELASAFTGNFERLWKRGRNERSGRSGEEVLLEHGVRATPSFSPSPPFLGHLAAGIMVAADRRLHVVSPVVTSGAVLGTLCEQINRQKLGVTGAYDATQMQDVQRQWEAVPQNNWKIAAWRTIAPHLSGKRSTPFAPGSVHDYMHAKFIVVDDHVLTGSYNLSKHGEGNAENVVHLVGEELATRFAAFADQIAERYRA